MMPDCPLPASSSNLNPNAVRHHLIKRITFKLHYGVPHQPQRKTKQDRSSKREKIKLKQKKSLDALALFMVQHPNPPPPCWVDKKQKMHFHHDFHFSSLPCWKSWAFSSNEHQRDAGAFPRVENDAPRGGVGFLLLAVQSWKMHSKWIVAFFLPSTAGKLAGSVAGTTQPEWKVR